MEKNYNEYVKLGAVARTLSQLDEQDAEIFEALYNLHPDDIGIDYMGRIAYNGDKEFWNIAANIFEGNIMAYDSIDEYAHEMFSDIDRDTFETYFDYEGYGKHLRETLDEEQLEDFDAKNISNTELAEEFISYAGGYDSLEDWDYDEFFDFEMFGEALAECIYEGKVYDVGGMEVKLGERLKENMYELIEKEFANLDMSGKLYYDSNSNQYAYVVADVTEIARNFDCEIYLIELWDKYGEPIDAVNEDLDEFDSIEEMVESAWGLDADNLKEIEIKDSFTVEETIEQHQDDLQSRDDEDR